MWRVSALPLFGISTDVVLFIVSQFQRYYVRLILTEVGNTRNDISFKPI